MTRPLLKDTLFEILKIINYLNNKEKFVKEFEELNQQEALLNILEKLPKETQDKIKQITDEKEAIEEIRKYISQEEYVPELIKVSNEALAQFIKDVEPTLTSQQKEKIAALFQP